MTFIAFLIGMAFGISLPLAAIWSVRKNADRRGRWDRANRVRPRTEEE
jgi:hypothetical protein